MLGDKFRLRFEKVGVLRLLSHHDLMRVLERMLRRAGIPFKSTAGFHPSPRVVFAQSLPLGVAGLDEVVELELTEPRESDDVLAGLNAQAPVGLRFLRAAVVPMKTTAMPRRIVYELPLPPGRVEETAAACARLLVDAKVWVDRFRPNPKGLNIRPYLRRVEVLEPTRTEVQEAGRREHPSPLAGEGRGWGEGVAGVTGASPTEPRVRDAAGTPGRARVVPPSPTPPPQGGRGDSASDPLPRPEARSVASATPSVDARLTLDLWVTTTGTARADELLKLLGVDDLLDAGHVLSRTTVELRDEAAAPPVPTDTPPDGPADTRPLDPAVIAARAGFDQPAAAGVAVPGDLSVE